MQCLEAMRSGYGDCLLLLSRVAGQLLENYGLACAVRPNILFLMAERLRKLGLQSRFAGALGSIGAKN